MLKRFFAVLPFIATATASHADNCEQIRAQIESKYRSGGVTNFTVKTIDGAASAPGKVVGSCGNGTKRIVFNPGMQPIMSASPASRPTAASKPDEKPILTECKDGTVSYNGKCNR